MSDKVSVSEKKEKLQEIVDLFKCNIKQYKSTSYDESNTRVDFIDKYFELLDWDVRNIKGYSEQYREVVREDKISIEGKHKAPDYSFRIGGVRKFFVEAKKPSVNIREDIEPAFQLRRYAYTSKLPLSVLTDFEEIAVFDTRIKPHKNDKASMARVFYCTYEDFLKPYSDTEYETNFDFLYNTFSKPAILKGSFDKYIEENKNKKGTSEVDKEFLKLIESWRTALSKNVAIRNINVDLYNLNYAVQKLIDRIIFLRIAEDRKMEEYGLLKKTCSKKDIYRSLVQIFLNANQKYNAGLFKNEDWLNNLNIEDKVLSDIISSMYYPDCPYEFSVMPIQILGHVYEQFLGKTIRLTAGHQAKVEDKPEVRKAGGVYYTPQYIVDYIVENTVGRKVKRKTPEYIENITILDPACGSGSFLVRAYDFLLKHHLNYYCQKSKIQTALSKGKIYQIDDNTYYLSTLEKQKVLLNNIYGVDIDPQAVEVTKLSLLLKLLEDENIEAEKELFTHTDFHLLPDLCNNIKCGNSLISSDFYDGKQLDLFDNEEVRKINVFDWEKQFPEVFKNRGFDIIIGNPPYVRPENVDKIERNYYLKSNKYKLIYGRFDIYILFVERALIYLKDNGFFSYIIPSSIYNQNYSKHLREYILKNFKILNIIDFENLKIFQDASVKSTILVINKCKANNHKVEVNIIKNILDFPNKISNKIRQEIFLKFPQCMIRTDLNETDINLINKLELNSIKLNDICYVVIGAVPHDSKSGASKDRLISNTKVKASQKKYIEGKDMDRYIIKYRGKYIDYQPELMHRPKFPELFENPKIIVRNISNKDGLKSTIDYENYYTNDTLSICILWFCLIGVNQRGTDASVDKIELSKKYKLELLLGVINSKLINFYFSKILSSNLHVYPEAIRNMPIFNIAFDNKSINNKIIDSVIQMLEIQKLFQNAETDNDKKLYKHKIDILDNQIDNLVYKLYGLTEEEIKIVEESIS